MTTAASFFLGVAPRAASPHFSRARRHAIDRPSRAVAPARAPPPPAPPPPPPPPALRARRGGRVVLAFLGRSAHGPVPRGDDRGPVRPPRVRHRAPVVRPAAAADAVPALERPLLRPRVVRVRVRRDGRRRARARVRRGAQHREPRGGRRPAPERAPDQAPRGRRPERPRLLPVQTQGRPAVPPQGRVRPVLDRGRLPGDPGGGRVRLGRRERGGRRPSRGRRRGRAARGRA